MRKAMKFTAVGALRLFRIAVRYKSKSTVSKGVSSVTASISVASVRPRRTDSLLDAATSLEIKAS